MLKKKITYVNFDGKEVTEDFYFNLTQAEATELEIKLGLSDKIKQIIGEVAPDATPEKIAEMVPKLTKDQSVMLIDIVKELISRSYGERSEDGRHFIKTPTIRDSFAATEAYSVLFMELVTSGEATAAFMSGVLPKIAPNK